MDNISALKQVRDLAITAALEKRRLTTENYQPNPVDDFVAIQAIDSMIEVLTRAVDSRKYCNIYEPTNDLDTTTPYFYIKYIKPDKDQS